MTEPSRTLQYDQDARLKRKLEDHAYVKQSAVAFRRHALKDRRENIKLRAALAALGNLVTRLDVIHEDPAFKSVWVVNQLHAGPYTGPKYETELNDARAVLNKLKATSFGWTKSHDPQAPQGHREMSDLFLERDAVISDCGKYRYLLRRTWDHDKPRALFIMLNPSTADAEVDDATIRSCIRLSKGMGYGSFEVVNLFAWRATDPKNLPSKASDATGPNNPRMIEAAVARCDTVICAWGANLQGASNARGVLDIIRLYRPAAYCLGTTKTGAPKHPLYIKSGTPLQVYR